MIDTDDLIYSKTERIPLFRLVVDEGDENCAEFYNYRRKLFEVVPISVLIVHLIAEEAICSFEGTMVYVPGEIKRTPIGIMRRDSRGTFLEIKKGKKSEVIYLQDYVALLLGGKVRKAG